MRAKKLFFPLIASMFSARAILSASMESKHKQLRLLALKVVFQTEYFIESVVTIVKDCLHTNTCLWTAFALARIAVVRHGNKLSITVQELQRLSLRIFLELAKPATGNEHCAQLARCWLRGELFAPSEVTADELADLEDIGCRASPTGSIIHFSALPLDNLSEEDIGEALLHIPILYSTELIMLSINIARQCLAQQTWLWQAYSLLTMLINDDRFDFNNHECAQIIDLQPRLLILYALMCRAGGEGCHIMKNSWYLLFYDYQKRPVKNYASELYEVLRRLAQPSVKFAPSLV